MFNCSEMEVFNKEFFDNLLKGNGDLYFAHLPKPEQKGSKPELLSEHSALTCAYAKKMVEVNDLFPIIQRLVNDSIPQKLKEKPLLAEMMEKMFWRAIAFHDLGKLNHQFQNNRMRNNADILKVEHEFGSQHSIISAYLYLALFFKDFMAEELSDEEQIFICSVAIYMSCPILQHHRPAIGYCQNDDEWSEKNSNEYVCRKSIMALRQYIHLIDCPLDDSGIDQFHDCFLSNANYNFFFERYNNITEDTCGFPLYALVKLLYSLLTASDYLATAHYMNNWQNMLTDFGIMNESIKDKIIDNAHNSKIYNQKTFADADAGKFINPDAYRERNGNNLNVLREGLAIDVIKNIRQNSSKRLFYIEAPTGGGKTNASMLALSELLTADPTIQNVFYVFPFTTLITQTFKSIKETLGLSDGEVIEFHSKAPKNTGDYEDDYINYLDNLFLNFPVVLLSHVSFFEVLKTNAKDNNYLLQRLAHSVVIIDEVQSYSPKIWDKMIYFIVNYAEYFDMRFILMSATLPKIGNLIDNKILGNDFVYLIDNKNGYFKNPNFASRVNFDYSLLKWDKPEKDNIPDYLERLCKFVDEEANKYSESNIDYPNSVFTVIEFIFKKTASDFYEIMQNSTNCFDEIMLLSGTILEPRRRQIISALKSETYRKRKVLLITTQVVEAGVDIDMDLGFKDKSLIDSEEQIAGRINRNANKETCKLYLFDCNSEKILYGKDDRLKFLRDFDDSEYQNILNNKDFDYLYNKIIEYIKKKNNSLFIENLNDLYKFVACLDYKSASESFEIINQRNTSVFVPLEIDSCLIDNSFLQIAHEFNIHHGEKLSGCDVWEKYEEIIQNQEDDFIQNRIKLNKIQGLLSQFIFSVFPNSKDEASLKTYGEEKYGYLYLESYSNIYSFENGINTAQLSESNFL